MGRGLSRLKISFSGSLMSKRFRAPGMKPKLRGELMVHDRHMLIGGFDQDAIRETSILQIGCGMGSLFALGYARKGFSKIILLDPDFVDLTNLTRQFYYENDRGENKAHCLGKNLMPHATDRIEIVAHGMRWEDALELDLDVDADIVVCAVDSPATRCKVAMYYLQKGVPVIFTAVGLNADKGYIFVQESKEGTPCFLCAFPEETGFRSRLPCAVGSSIDVLLCASGFVLYAVDSLIMDRPRIWNRMWISLSGTSRSGAEQVQLRPDCPVCGANVEGRK